MRTRTRVELAGCVALVLGCSYCSSTSSGGGGDSGAITQDASSSGGGDSSNPEEDSGTPRLDASMDAPPDHEETADGASLDAGDAAMSSLDAAADAPAESGVDATLSDAGTDATLGIGITCDAGIACEGQCIDPTSDPENCGACGHSCLGAQCCGGGCGPLVAAVTTGSAPWSIAADSDEVYWSGGSANAWSIYACSPSGGCSSPGVVGTGTSGGVPWVVASPPNFLSVQNSATTRATLVDGTCLNCIDAGAGAPGVQLGAVTTSDSTNLYWVNQNPSTSATQIYDCALTGCSAPTLIATSPAGYPAAVVSDGQYVYWLDLGLEDDAGATDMASLYQCPIGGCLSGGPTVLASFRVGYLSGIAGQMAVDSSNVYFWVPNLVTDDAGNQNIEIIIDECAVGGCLAQGPTPIVTVPNYHLGLDFVTDGTNLYFATSPDGTNFSVQSCPIADCSAPVTLASDQRYAAALALDPQSVFWSGSTTQAYGYLMRVAKPAPGAGSTTCPTAGDGGAPPFLVSTYALSPTVTCNGASGTTLGSLSSPTITVTNPGSAPLTFTASLPGSNFTLSSTGSTLAAGDSTTLTVSAVAFTGYPPSPSITSTLTLQGGGETLEIPVAENFNGVFVEPESVNFGDVATGQSGSMTITTTSTPNELDCTSLTTNPSNVFQFQNANPLSSSPQQWTVSFHPTTTGMQSGVLTFCGSPQGSQAIGFCTPTTVSLTGTGE